MTLRRVWFDAIVDGSKKIEFRQIKPYWTKKLEGRAYDVIEFRNGYAQDAPTMQVEYDGLTQAEIGYSNGEKEKVYALKLGRVLWTKNYDGRKELPAEKNKYEQVFKKASRKNLSTH